MLSFPVWIFFAGSVVVFIAGLLKAGRVLLSIISFLVSLSAAMTVCPFIFFTKPRIFGHFCGFFAFRVEPFACIASACLSLLAAGCTVRLALYYPQQGIRAVFALLLLAAGLATASLFAANIPTVVSFTGATFLVLLVLHRNTRLKDKKTSS